MEIRTNLKLEEALQDYLNAVSRENMVGGYRLANFLMRNLKKNELEDLMFQLNEDVETDFEPKTPISIKDLNLKSPLSL